MNNWTTAQKISVGFGVVYLIVGILGFIPGITQPSDGLSDVAGEGLLMGLFGVNVIHNISHLMFAAILILGGLSREWVGIVNRVLAVVFVVLVLSYFIGPVANSLALNLPDLILHLGSALITGYVGFVLARDENRTTTTGTSY